MPGSNTRMLERAASSQADQVFIDLEDAVAPTEKAKARTNAVEALRSLDWGSKLRVVRINSIRSPYMHRDVIALLEEAAGRLDCLLIPKIESPGDVYAVEGLLAGLEAELAPKRQLGLELLIETARGAVCIREIAHASARTEAIVFGPGDYSLDMGVLRFEIGMVDQRYPGHQWHWVMSEVAVHARATGVQAIDGPCVNFSDREGYVELAQRAKLLGFEGKWCIHPNQIPWANEVFSVAPEEVARARSVLEMYEEAVRGGRGAAVVDGIMVDDAARKIAEMIIARADALATTRA